MSPLVVVAPPAVAPGFALGGATVRVVLLDERVDRAIEAALGADHPIVAVHHELWNRVPAAVRARWERRTDRLVLALPPDDGLPAEQRAAELHELLARAVGYEISFIPGGTP